MSIVKITNHNENIYKVEQRFDKEVATEKPRM